MLMKTESFEMLNDSCCSCNYGNIFILFLQWFPFISHHVLKKTHRGGVTGLLSLGVVGIPVDAAAGGLIVSLSLTESGGVIGM